MRCLCESGDLESIYAVVTSVQHAWSYLGAVHMSAALWQPSAGYALFTAAPSALFIRVKRSGGYLSVIYMGLALWKPSVCYLGGSGTLWAICGLLTWVRRPVAHICALFTFRLGASWVPLVIPWVPLAFPCVSLGFPCVPLKFLCAPPPCPNGI